MPHSLRAKLSGLRYKGILEDKDYKRLCKALDNENVLEKIRAEVEQIDAPKDYPYNMVTECVKAEVLQIINKYR